MHVCRANYINWRDILKCDIYFFLFLLKEHWWSKKHIKCAQYLKVNELGKAPKGLESARDPFEALPFMHVGNVMYAMAEEGHHTYMHTIFFI